MHHLVQRGNNELITSCGLKLATALFVKQTTKSVNFWAVCRSTFKRLPVLQPLSILPSVLLPEQTESQHYWTINWTCLLTIGWIAQWGLIACLCSQYPVMISVPKLVKKLGTVQLSIYPRHTEARQNPMDAVQLLIDLVDKFHTSNTRQVILTQVKDWRLKLFPPPDCLNQMWHQLILQPAMHAKPLNG